MSKKYTLTGKETFQRWALSFAGAIIPPLVIIIFDTNDKSNYSLVILASVFSGFLFTQLILKLSIEDIVDSIINDNLEREKKLNSSHLEKELNLNGSIEKLSNKLQLERDKNKELTHSLDCAKEYCDIKNIKTECLTIINSIQSLLEDNYTTKQMKGFMLYLSKKINESEYFNSRIEHYLSFVTVYGKSNNYSGFENNTINLLDEYLKNVNEGNPNTYKEKRFKM